MNDTCPRCGSARTYGPDGLPSSYFSCDFVRNECRIRTLEAACRNVVTAIPNEHACDPAFWPVREQCRKALGETT